MGNCPAAESQLPESAAVVFKGHGPAPEWRNTAGLGTGVIWWQLLFLRCPGFALFGDCFPDVIWESCVEYYLLIVCCPVSITTSAEKAKPKNIDQLIFIVILSLTSIWWFNAKCALFYQMNADAEKEEGEEFDESMDVFDDSSSSPSGTLRNYPLTCKVVYSYKVGDFLF